MTFDDQRKAWYAKALGAADLESPDDPDGPLRERGQPDAVRRLAGAPVDTADAFSRRARAAREVSAGDYDALSDYYSAARAYAEERHWASKRERAIWLLHCEGASYRRIVRKVFPVSKRAWVGYHTVERVVRMVRMEVLGMRQPPKRRGRPRVVGGRGRDATIVSARLNEREASALHALVARLKCTESTAIAAAIVFAAKNG